MQYLFEHFAVAVCAITGVLAGRGKRVDLFGVVVLALVTALGGGTLRDVILQHSPVFWIEDSNYVLNAVTIALLTFLLARSQEPPLRLLLIADAFGLALFTMIGVEKSLHHGVSNTGAVVLGVVTGVAGGMMRDLLSGEIPLVFRREIHLYATAALCGALVFVALNHWLPADRLNLFLAATTTLLLRLAGIRWKLGLPVFHPHPSPPEAGGQNVPSDEPR